MAELDVYLSACFGCIPIGAAAGCIAWLVGYAVSSVFAMLRDSAG